MPMAKIDTTSCPQKILTTVGFTRQSYNLNEIMWTFDVDRVKKISAPYCETDGDVKEQTDTHIQGQKLLYSTDGSY